MVIFIISFLLLSPVVRFISFYLEKPIIIFAQDNSESLSLLKNREANSLKLYSQEIKDFVSSLSDNYDVKAYRFGDKIVEGSNFDFLDKETDFVPVFDEINKKYINYNIGALVIASDGIYNKGGNPLYNSRDFPFPVYTIALGDTTKKHDIVIKSAYSNQISFLGDYFPVEILITANGFNGQAVSLKIYNQGKEINSKIVQINKQDFSSLLKFDILAENKGIQQYTIKIESKPGEYNLKNNTKELLIDILDNKKKILILSNAPHPDISAIRKALETNKNLIVESFFADEFSRNVSEYQLVICHQLPGTEFKLQKIHKQLVDNNIPTLFVIGQNTDLAVFNSLKSGIEIQSDKKLFEQALPILNTNFNLFEIDNNFIELIHNCPPLNVPFADYIVNSGQQILLYQKIKGIKTTMPLISFMQGQESGLVKYGIVFGDGIWQWRIKDYLVHENHHAFDSFINKLVTFLSLDVKKERFMVYHKRTFTENEDIIFRAELYNKSFELINSPDILLNITNQEKKEYDYLFTRTGKSYVVDAGQLPVGDYTYSANTEFDHEKFQKAGEFKILPLNIEHLELTANHALLNQISVQTGGKMFLPNELENLLQELKNNENIKTISHSTFDLIDFIEVKWIVLLLIFLLTIEWFTRKYFGAY